MKTVDHLEAETHLSRLVDGAVGGEPFIITEAGKPSIKVVPFDAPAETASCRIGFLAESVPVPDDFNRMSQDEIERLFEGRWGSCSTRSS